MTLVEDVRAIIAEIAEVDPAAVGEETSLREELDVDSMMVLEIMSAIEGKYDIKIPDEKAGEFTTLRAIVAAVGPSLPAVESIQVLD